MPENSKRSMAHGDCQSDQGLGSGCRVGGLGRIQSDLETQGMHGGLAKTKGTRIAGRQLLGSLPSQLDEFMGVASWAWAGGQPLGAEFGQQLPRLTSPIAGLVGAIAHD